MMKKKTTPIYIYIYIYIKNLMYVVAIITTQAKKKKHHCMHRPLRLKTHAYFGIVNFRNISGGWMTSNVVKN